MQWHKISSQYFSNEVLKCIFLFWWGFLWVFPLFFLFSVIFFSLYGRKEGEYKLGSESFTDSRSGSALAKFKEPDFIALKLQGSFSAIARSHCFNQGVLNSWY